MNALPELSQVLNYLMAILALILNVVSHDVVMRKSFDAKANQIY